MSRLRFRPAAYMAGMPPTLYALAGKWSFVIISRREGWTVSYRLRKPTGAVSASSTIRGPIETQEEAESVAADVLAQLRRQS